MTPTPKVNSGHSFVQEFVLRQGPATQSEGLSGARLAQTRVAIATLRAAITPGDSPVDSS